MVQISYFVNYYQLILSLNHHTFSYRIRFEFWFMNVIEIGCLPENILNNNPIR